ncbi:hypothetical protein D3C80_1427750 [compost metagenome]
MRFCIAWKYKSYLDPRNRVSSVLCIHNPLVLPHNGPVRITDAPAANTLHVHQASMQAKASNKSSLLKRHRLQDNTWLSLIADRDHPEK